MIEIINVSGEYKLRLQGWVQDASDFDNLWLFLNAFVANSPKFTTIKNKVESLVKPESLKTELISVMEKPALAYSYLQIVGKKNGSESRKTSTVCNGIGQAAMTGQVRPYLGDWPTNNFLRWAIVLDFIQRNDESETYSITPLGKQLVLEESREKRLPILRKALLMYPPARRSLWHGRKNLLVSTCRNR